MKRTFLFLVLIISTHLLRAQNVGIGTTTPNASAQLDISSVDKGILIPRMAETQKLAIASPAPGLMIYNTSSGSFQYFNGTLWNNITHSGIVTGSNNRVPKFTGLWGLGNSMITDNGSGVSINSSATNPDASSILDIQSTTKGMLIPRMTSAERTAIVSPVKGLLVFDNTTSSFWFFDGSAWQAIGGGTGDGLWYEAQPNLAYASKTYAGVNSDLNLVPLQANLQVGGSLLVQAALKHTNAAPTAGQVYTMYNTINLLSIEGDSTFKLYDPGGTGNYTNNIVSNARCSTANNQVGFSVSSVAADFGLGTGDTVWISPFTFPSCRTDYSLRFTSTSTNPEDFIFNGSANVVFKSNGDANNNKGFQFIITRLYHSQVDKRIYAAGPALYFNGGNGSFAVGSGAEAVKVGDVALGTNAKANGGWSSSIGLLTRASGQYSTAIGYGANANGFSATTIGSFCEATNDYATAIGYDNKASADYAFATGAQTLASGNSSTSSGYSTDAAGHYSFSAGYYTIARGFAGTVIGQFNDPVLASAQTASASGSPLFIIGNGTNSSNRSNAMIVLRNGDVGIGTASNPADRLHVDGGNMTLNNSSGTTFQLQAGGVQKGFVQLSGDDLRIGTYSTNNTGDVVFRLNGADRFYIYPNGNATLTGTLTQNSDARFKQDIIPISNALEKVMQLHGYQYHWKSELKRDSSLQIGLIAQNVETVLPQLVITDKEGNKSVAYQNMVPVLIEAMKEQQQQIDSLKKINQQIPQLLLRIEQLEKKN